jgi:hypothetical protein
LIIYTLCYAFYLPDRIDFFIGKVTVLEKRLEKKKKVYGSWNESDDFAIVATCYWSDYPDRIPFIADRKMVVYGPYRKVYEHYGRKPQSKLVHMYGNWYFWYYENNEMPG